MTYETRSAISEENDQSLVLLFRFYWTTLFVELSGVLFLIYVITDMKKNVKDKHFVVYFFKHCVVCVKMIKRTS